MGTHSMPEQYSQRSMSQGCMFSSDLPPTLSAESVIVVFYCYCGGENTKLRLSQHRKLTGKQEQQLFRRLSYRKFNPRPFDHKSGALLLIADVPVPDPALDIFDLIVQ